MLPLFSAVLVEMSEKCCSSTCFSSPFLFSSSLFFFVIFIYLGDVATLRAPQRQLVRELFQRHGAAMARFWWGSLPGLQTAVLSHTSSHGSESKRVFLLSFPMRALTPPQVLQLRGLSGWIDPEPEPYYQGLSCPLSSYWDWCRMSETLCFLIRLQWTCFDSWN